MIFGAACAIDARDSSTSVRGRPRWKRDQRSSSSSGFDDQRSLRHVLKADNLRVAQGRLSPLRPAGVLIMSTEQFCEPAYQRTIFPVWCDYQKIRCSVWETPRTLNVKCIRRMYFHLSATEPIIWLFVGKRCAPTLWDTAYLSRISLNGGPIFGAHASSALLLDHPYH